ncbi:hypothetical protein BKA70DRAFT_1247525 [Coprinopsis sp. MPI-PUGE-AT-0042]|nr:hypothetical protein BKA70DRAFT_1247525 [Coprinopsis sp. MPI-PUGE-AT-0042]
MDHEETPFEALLEEAQLDDHDIDSSLPEEVNYELEAIMDDFRVGPTFKQCIHASVPYNLACCQCDDCFGLDVWPSRRKEAPKLIRMISRVERLVRRMEDERMNYVKYLERKRAQTVVLVALGKDSAESTSKEAKWLAQRCGWSLLYEDV